MGWDVASKSVIRQNTDFSGSNVWAQDQVAGIKVIATRHDDHDQDLADAISACLNLDGINAMRASFSMGSFKITNLAKGTVSTDAARVGQLISSASFDDGTRVLTLTSTDQGNLTVTIPSGTGGGGSGTVTSITIGEGLSGTVSPITTFGDIKLATIGTLQSFTGGISAITVDKHGRVTSVTEGGYSSTNLAVANRTSTTLDVTSSTGTSATIPVVTTSLAGLMSAADKTTLNNLASASGTNITVTENATTVTIASSTGTNDTIAAATGALAGVMLPTDKTKLDGLVSNATHSGDVSGSTTLTLQPEAITGKTALTSGLASTDELLVSDAGTLKRMDVSVIQSYMQGSLSFAAASHSHSGSAITSGTVGISYLPTGVTGTTVALGDHLHTGVYSPSGHTHTTVNDVSGVALNISGTSTMTSDAADDYLIIYDTSVAGNRRVALPTLKNIGGVSGQKVTIASTAPGSPSTNDIWIDVS